MWERGLPWTQCGQFLLVIDTADTGDITKKLSSKDDSFFDSHSGRRYNKSIWAYSGWLWQDKVCSARVLLLYKKPAVVIEKTIDKIILIVYYVHSALIQ